MVLENKLGISDSAELARQEEKISKNLLAGAVKKDESVKTEYIDEETIKVTLEMEFEEEIGTQAPLKVRE